MDSARPEPMRGVIVGTVVQPYWEQYPGLKKRLKQLTTNVDRMHAESQRNYGRGIDLAILPEVSITGEAGRNVANGMYSPSLAVP